MKSNLRMLELVFRLTRLKPDMFYSIGFSSSGISLQGFMNKESVKIIESFRGFKKVNRHSEGYLVWFRNNIEITLT